MTDNWAGEQNPSPWKIWSRASVKNLQRPVAFFQKASHLVPAVIRANQQKSNDDALDTQRVPMVRTRFNGRVTTTRVTDAIIVELERIKAIRRAVAGVTVNDVIVAIVGGGLRKYLMAKGELPEASLSCGAPISSAGLITINFTCTREMLPDPEFYSACLRESLEELCAAAGVD